MDKMQGAPWHAQSANSSKTAKARRNTSTGKRKGYHNEHGPRATFAERVYLWAN